MMYLNSQQSLACHFFSICLFVVVVVFYNNIDIVHSY